MVTTCGAAGNFSVVRPAFTGGAGFFAGDGEGVCAGASQNSKATSKTVLPQRRKGAKIFLWSSFAPLRRCAENPVISVLVVISILLCDLCASYKTPFGAN